MSEKATTRLSSQEIKIVVDFPQNDGRFQAGNLLTILGHVTWTSSEVVPFATLWLMVLEKRLLGRWKYVDNLEVTDTTISDQGVMNFKIPFTPTDDLAQYLFTVEARDDTNQILAESPSVLIHSVDMIAYPGEPAGMVTPILDQPGLKVYRIVPNADKTGDHNHTDVEYVLTVRFEGGPILIGVADQSFKPTDTGGGIDELLDATFTDAPTNWNRFDPDPYYRSPDQCVASGTLIFRVPRATSKFVKRVAVSVVLTNYLLSQPEPHYRLTLISANNTDPLVVDTGNDSVKITDFGQLNIVLLIGESDGVACKRAETRD